MAIVINGSGTVTGISVGGLPDGIVDDGTLATDSVTAAKLEVSAITGADLPAGSVLQVVQGVTSTSVSTTSTSYVVTGLTASITPSATSSKIMIFASCCVDNNVDGRQGFFGFFRDTTNLSGGASSVHGSLYANGARVLSNISAQLVDSPSSTSAIEYSWRMKCPDGGEVEFCTQGTEANMTLMEIAG